MDHGQIILAQDNPENPNLPPMFSQIGPGGAEVSGELEGMLRTAPVEPAQTPTISGLSQAPKASIPNSIYEQLGPRGDVKSRTFYDQSGRPFSRQDFGHAHAGIKPHEHNFSYNAAGQVNGRTVVPLPPGYVP